MSSETREYWTFFAFFRVFFTSARNFFAVKSPVRSSLKRLFFNHLTAKISAAVKINNIAIKIDIKILFTINQLFLSKTQAAQIQR